MGRKKKDDEIDWKDMPEGDEKRNKYMKSPEWKEVRARVLERDHHRCRCCGRNEDQANLSIHHSTYNNGVLYHELEGNNMDWMVTLCIYCHSSIHRNKANIHRFKKPNK